MKLADNKATLSFSNGGPSVELPVYKGTIGRYGDGVRQLALHLGHVRELEGGADGGQQAAEEAHDGRVQQSAQEQRRGDGERECDLAERLPVHGGGLVAVEGCPREQAADRAADQAQQQRLAEHR